MENIYILTAIFNGKEVQNFTEFMFAYANVEVGLKRLYEKLAGLSFTGELNLKVCNENFIHATMNTLEGETLEIMTKCSCLYK